MADDLVVREWDWSVYGGLLTRQILDEHNALARAYLERDAQLAERDALLKEVDSGRHAWEMTRRARDLVLAQLAGLLKYTDGIEDHLAWHYAQLVAMTAERDAHKDHGWAALNERDDARREVLCLRDKLTASEAARVSDLNTLDSVCAELGIQDSDDTPAEAIQKLKRDLERERVKTSKLATTLQALLGTTPEERQTPSIWFPRVDAARAALHEFAEIFALAEAGKAGEP